MYPNQIDIGGWERIIPEAAFNIAQENYLRAIKENAAGPHRVFPPANQIFSALQITPPEKVKLAICGQDPYYIQHYAHGLSFSVPEGVQIPKSLQNIFTELSSDVGCTIPSSGCLVHWAEQGVLLLNSVLTVYEGKPGSNQNWGWQAFTKAILEATRELPQPICFILWGNHAQAIAQATNVCCSPYPRRSLQSPHPSPLSAYRGFFGSKPFSQANEWLVANGCAPIKW